VIWVSSRFFAAETGDGGVSLTVDRVASLTLKEETSTLRPLTLHVTVRRKPSAGGARECREAEAVR